MKNWYLYIVRCSDGSLYTGVTTDIDRRILEHNYGMKAAKYTRSRRPVRLVYEESCKDHSTALKREYQIKRLSKEKKENLVETYAQGGSSTLK